VQTFDATFEQHCEGGAPAARGEIHISNSPGPPPASPKHAATTSPHATTTSPHTSPTSTPTATGSGDTAANDSAANDTDANTRATAPVVRNPFRTPLLLIGVGVVAWVVFVAVGLVVVGIVMAVRLR
jgi:hypothetical protein